MALIKDEPQMVKNPPILERLAAVERLLERHSRRLQSRHDDINELRDELGLPVRDEPVDA